MNIEQAGRVGDPMRAYALALLVAFLLVGCTTATILPEPQMSEAEALFWECVSLPHGQKPEECEEQ